MKTITRELAHTGMFGPDGVTITKRHLSDCKETFDGKCPITLGHRLADWMPKFGNVQSVDLAKGGESLVGKVELHDLLADAVDERLYEDVSVGIQTRKSDGKHYLHHLAFLGAVPPKIRDLKVFADIGVVYLGDEEPVAMFADAAPQPVDTPAPGAPEEVAAALRSIADKGRAGWPFNDVVKALAELTSYATEMLLSGAPIPASLKEQMQNFADQFNAKTKAAASAVAGDAGEEEDVEIKEENKRLKAELADQTAASKATAKEGLKQAMEGKIPKAKQGLVLELADHLDTKASIELADGEGKKETVSSLEILRRVIDAIPKAVTEGRTDLGDPEPAEAKTLDLSKIAGKF
jgi:hypothetical protein